ncbi:MAG: threonine-phosphate decarboxylase CobD [Lachnospiraceae bacterium]
MVNREKGIHIHGGDVYQNKVHIDFSANINFLGMPKEVSEAAKQSIEAANRYPDPNCTQLKEAISLYHGIPKEQIICGNGAAELIFLLVQALKPARALLLAPCFFEYEKALIGAGTEIVQYVLKEEDNFLLSEDFLQELTQSIDVLFLCNPNNPTGQLISPDLLKEILERCNKNKILLVLDECFNDFICTPQEYSLLGQLEEYKNLFILKAFTKMYAIPGLRLGYGLSSNKELLQKMEEKVQPWSVSVPAQAAGTAACALKEFPRQTRQRVQVEKQYLLEQLQQFDVTIFGWAANYIFFKGKTGLCSACMEEGILIRDCSNFYGLKEGFYRIAIKSREENRQLIQVLSQILRKG